jgi:hypothetical protein
VPTPYAHSECAQENDGTYTTRLHIGGEVITRGGFKSTRTEPFGRSDMSRRERGKFTVQLKAALEGRGRPIAPGSALSRGAQVRFRPLAGVEPSEPSELIALPCRRGIRS